MSISLRRSEPPCSPRRIFVLSGGAARGAVEVGMMQTLIEAGVVPDALVGTSVGALNAAFVGFRPDAARVRELAERWVRLSGREIFPDGPLRMAGHLLRGHPYLCDPGPLGRLIEGWVPEPRLERLAVPVRVVTTPLGSATASYHDSGDLVSLLLASAAVPGVFPAVSLADAEGASVPHVDGGVADLVPVAGARDLVPLVGSSGSMRAAEIYVLDATVPARVPRARTPIEIVVASLGVATRVRPMPDLGPSVVVHHLTTSDLGTRMRDFSRTAEHLALGRRAAADLLDHTSTSPARATDRGWLRRLGRAA
ncbi:patatin-like phospholipase family protein [Nocardioides sp. R-C-SC26]|uniref:patatin-like phospholipase family protein n=1 Tax=Nocardioides sp. R-C-SC26 TaxID=2870414 RepID=UPI001E47A470|nr:patatin-like phospholipase family protein [Nocardioides sp. R-C-SC26]